MSKFPRLSGITLVKILVKKFSFQVARQTGSHVVLHKFADDNEKIVTVVPLHRDVKPGTLSSILALAKISKDEFTGAL
ncbi:MAG: type II toxin-antitoxin system HicA family toxin [Thaumarchaeota archaeon]|nr:type II toxin-antitoxin system HicA family toxin [Nitrososphaerota archaeon]MDE0265650.1 type II toxin-antitoxin system HicA family toxin [Nitrososphaerota archaeon]MDE0525493.1 type II toxin-antitoxin system HicA family toxin [Nitrososphaerota archaeon]